MNKNVVHAVFKRNFFSYFSSPTGYAFICVFVLLSSFAAFWPAEFFNANLANLEQLNNYFPYIMLVFIPAITMGVWAEERRQGTDELLLTIPATDYDVVTGKYLAAVAIYTVSLVFSLVSNGLVLVTLGQPDVGLLVATYIGYWFVGLAMLAIGMVASFLTPNLTVSYILGAALNTPLAFAAQAELLASNHKFVQAIKQWSLAEQFRDFSRGVVTFSGALYFVLLAVVMLYIAIVLIGRRHWVGARGGIAMAPHYAVRAICLLVVAASANVIFANHDLFRWDITTERLTSLSPETRKLLSEIDNKNTVRIDAYVSPRVPENYVQTRLNLLSTLREFHAIAGDKLDVRVHEVESFSEEATRAREKYNITSQRVQTITRGAMAEEDLFLGVAVTSGLEKVVIPFISRGIPIEYELVRSIATVSHQQRKRVGILQTDANLQGGFDMQTGASQASQRVIVELEKQYDVIKVDPSSPITEEFDVLLAVQPSSLTPEQMDNFLNLVLSGQPTAIFEDPFPFPGFWGNVVGTTQPKRPAGRQNPFMQQPPPAPKGEISRLWSRLGIDFIGDQVVWQNHNPIPKLAAFANREWVFVDSGSGAKQPFGANSPISEGLQQMLFLYPGAVRKLNSCKLSFVPLATTGKETGTVGVNDILVPSFMGLTLNPNLPLFEHPTGVPYHLAVRLKGKLPAGKQDEAATGSDEGETSEGKKASKEEDLVAGPEVNIVLVADMDLLHSAFFDVRAQGNDASSGLNMDFDNVTFVLNALDDLAGDERFINIRKRRRIHRTLSAVEAATSDARKEADVAREKFNKEFESARTKEQAKFDERITELENRKGIDPQQMKIEILSARQAGQRRLQVQIAKLQQDRDQQIKQIERDLGLQVRQVQDEYKRWAVILPPIPPLLVAFLVFFNRRAKEREHLSKNRLR